MIQFTKRLLAAQQIVVVAA